jgi:hypothetical protein
LGLRFATHGSLTFPPRHHSNFLGVFQQTANGDPVVTVFGAPGGQFVLQGGGSGYHNYEVSYYATSGTADLWVDGIERLTGLRATRGLVGRDCLFGENQGGGQANWNLVSVSIVPEPSPVSLILPGSGVLIYVSRTRKHCRS